MKRKVLNSRKAISPLIATLILITIITVGGLLVYTLFLNNYGILTSKSQITIEAVDLVKQTDGSVAFTITIKNTGNNPITRLAISLAGNDITGLTFFQTRPQPFCNPDEQHLVL